MKQIYFNACLILFGFSFVPNTTQSQNLANLTIKPVGCNILGTRHFGHYSLETPIILKKNNKVVDTDLFTYLEEGAKKINNLEKGIYVIEYVDLFQKINLDTINLINDTTTVICINQFRYDPKNIKSNIKNLKTEDKYIIEFETFGFGHGKFKLEIEKANNYIFASTFEFDYESQKYFIQNKRIMLTKSEIEILLKFESEFDKITPSSKYVKLTCSGLDIYEISVNKIKTRKEVNPCLWFGINTLLNSLDSKEK